MTSGGNVNVKVFNVKEGNPFQVLVSGNFQKKDINEMKKMGGSRPFELTLDKKSLFNIFTKTYDSEIILLVPESTNLDKVNVKAYDGDVRMINTKIKDLTIEINKGNIYVKNLKINRGDIKSRFGDVIIEETSGSFRVDNNFGKVIVQKLSGDLFVNSKNGLSTLSNSELNKVNYKKYNGDLIIQQSTIKKLNIDSTMNETNLNRVSGEISIKSDSGKTVAEEVQGVLNIQSNSGPSIIIQSGVLKSTVKSDSGLIKWVQNPSVDMNIVAKTTSGELKQDFKSVNNQEADVELISNNGDIIMLNKMDVIFIK